MPKLKNAKHEQFCLEYIIDLNGRQAAIRAGYSKNRAEQQGSRLLAMPIIAERVEELKRRREVKCNISAQYVLDRLGEIDRLNALDLFDDQGAILPIKDWPEAWGRSLSGLDVQQMLKAGDDQDSLRGAILKIKIPDKAKILELIGKHVSVKAWEKETADTGEALAEALKALAENLPN